jgi:DNA-binding NtrC family response regulator
MDRRKPASLIGNSRPLRELMEKAKRVASADVPVLLTGEVGTGMEEVAREIHGLSPYAKGPFIKINCAGLSTAQAETELFGRERRGSHDGPLQIGKLEFAQGGSLFLEQADRLPPAIQDKLLQVFIWKKITRVEGDSSFPISFRVMASVTLQGAGHPVEGFKEEFRRFFEGFILPVPNLIERKGDIPELIEHFLKISNLKAKVQVKSLTPEAVQFLTEYPWPGNIRELENSVEMMVLFAGKETLTIDDVPLDILIKQIDLAATKKEAKLSLKRARRQFERQYIRKVLEKTRGNQTRTADTLGLHRNTLIWKLRELSLEDDYRLIVQRRRERGLGFRDK